MHRMSGKFNLLYIFVGLTLVVIGIYLFKKPEPKIMIGELVIPVEVAVSDKEKNKGLGYRDKLGDGRGMIFVFDHKDQYPFWMRGMRFPIDILWISGNVIVEITDNVQVPGNPEDTMRISIYHPQAPIDRVLELNAGAAQKYGINIGDEVRYKL